MKRIIFAISFLIVASFAFQGCEKEKVAKDVNTDLSISEIKKKPSLTQLAAILGISVDNIVKVQHLSGLYECHNIYYPNGKLKEHWFKCNPPKDAYCCSLVYVNTHIGAKGNTNGYMGIKYDCNHQLISLFIIFDMETMQDDVWLKSSLLKIDTERPIGNASELNLCKGNQFVTIPPADYQLKEFETFKYLEINIEDLSVYNGNLVEE